MEIFLLAWIPAMIIYYVIKDAKREHREAQLKQRFGDNPIPRHYK